MKTLRFLALAAALIAGACGSDEIAQPMLDSVTPAFAKTNQRERCWPGVIGLGATEGTVSSSDCVYFNGTSDQYEDLYVAAQGRLHTMSGNQMATFTLEAEDFDWIFGLGGQVGSSVFPTPVYAYVPSNPDIHTFSLIGGEPAYTFWVGGRDTDQLGDYTLTVSAEATTNSCAARRPVYIQGDVSFTSFITDKNSCNGYVDTYSAGTVVTHPDIGANYQYWLMRVYPGEIITLMLTGVAGSSVVADIINLHTGEEVKDGPDGPGDTDRFVTFKADQRTDIYVEVRALKGEDSEYTATVTGPDTR